MYKQLKIVPFSCITWIREVAASSKSEHDGIIGMGCVISNSCKLWGKLCFVSNYLSALVSLRSDNFMGCNNQQLVKVTSWNIVACEWTQPD